MPPRFTPTESMLSGPNALVSMKGSSRTTPGEALQPGDSDLTHDARVGARWRQSPPICGLRILW
jgi:hypothetical protein